MLSKLFRGKYLDELKNLWEEKKLQFHGSSEKYRNHYVFKELLDLCYDKDWETKNMEKPGTFAEDVPDKTDGGTPSEN